MNESRRDNWRYTAIGALAAYCASTSAQIDSSSEALQMSNEHNSKAKDSPFEQILVTAQKRTEVSTDVGATLSVLDAKTLERVNTEELSDLTRFTPNFDIAETNNPAIYMRGVGISDFNTNNNGPIAVYVDEVYRSSIAGLNLIMFDMERVEVLKGPQGTLFGRNATGGALRLITQKPDTENSIKFSGLAGNLDTERFDIAANAALSDSVYARFSAVKATSDGFLNNTFGNNPADVSNTDLSAWRGQIMWDVSNELNLLFSAEGTHTNDGGPPFVMQGTIDPLTGAQCEDTAIVAGQCANPLGYFGEENRFDVNADRTPSFYDQDVKVYSLTANYSVEDWIFTSVSAYEMLDSERKNDEDVSPFKILNIDFTVRSQTFSQELRAGYDGERFRGTAGVFYLTENLDQDQSADIFRSVRPLIESIDQEMFPGGFDPLGTAIGIPAFNLRYINAQETETFALFGQGEYDLSDSLRVVGGLRYTEEDRDFDTLGQIEEAAFSVNLFDKILEIDNENFTFKFGFEKDFWNDTLLYGSIATGFKSGGFNGGFPQNPDEVVPYDEEELLSYEIGAKGINNDFKVQWSAALFYYNYTDMQVFVIDNSGVVPLTILSNAGDSTIYGLELDADWRPVDSLSFYFALGILNSEFDHFDTGQFNPDSSVEGNSIPYSPDLSFSTRATYSTNITERISADFNLGYQFKSEVFFTPENTIVYRQGALQLWDANISLADTQSNFKVSIFAENLFDKEYLALSLDASTFGFNQQVLGMPRTYGVRLSYEF